MWLREVKKLAHTQQRVIWYGHFCLMDPAPPSPFVRVYVLYRYLNVQELLQLEGCAAFVIKVSVVGGLHRSARLCRLARKLGAKAVLSSVFESGVGLAHASILASCFATQGKQSMCIALNSGFRTAFFFFFLGFLPMEP